MYKYAKIGVNSKTEQ